MEGAQPLYFPESRASFIAWVTSGSVGRFPNTVGSPFHGREKKKKKSHQEVTLLCPVLYSHLLQPVARMVLQATMTAPHLRVPNSPIDRAIMVLLGLGFTFMLSTMARIGLKVLLDMSEGFTDHLAFLPFIFPGTELLPPMLTCTSRTEGRVLPLFI